MINKLGTTTRLSFRPYMDTWNESGRKYCTTRLEKKADTGDALFRCGICYRVTGVNPMTLIQAVCSEWSKEWYLSRQEFVSELIGIYPELRNNKTAGKIVCVHYYRKW